MERVRDEMLCIFAVSTSQRFLQVRRTLDMNMKRIRTTLTEEGVTASRKLFHVLVVNGRGSAGAEESRT